MTDPVNSDLLVGHLHMFFLSAWTPRAKTHVMWLNLWCFYLFCCSMFLSRVGRPNLYTLEWQSFVCQTVQLDYSVCLAIISWIQLDHRLRGSVSTVVTMTSKSMGKQKFRPAVDRKSLKMLTPKLEWMITSWTPTTVPIFVEIGPTGSSPNIAEV